MAPSDETHTHTAAVGGTRLTADTTLELVLVQAGDAHQPMLDMHVVAPGGRLTITITGTQAWEIAGVLIDATVAHAQAAAVRVARTSAGNVVVPQRAGSVREQDRPVWLLDRHPNGRMSKARTRRVVRCHVRRRPRPGSGEPDIAE